MSAPRSFNRASDWAKLYASLPQQHDNTKGADCDCPACLKLNEVWADLRSVRAALCNPYGSLVTSTAALERIAAKVTP
jgi:hypothetical protein